MFSSSWRSGPVTKQWILAYYIAISNIKNVLSKISFQNSNVKFLIEGDEAKISSFQEQSQKLGTIRQNNAHLASIMFK